VRVNSFCEIEDSIILTATEVGRRAKLIKAIVAPGCRIPEGLVIGADPVLDAKRFERTPAGITLVTAPMLEALQ
jgi:glucose-1-phosphate adenylyltransferase